MVWYGVRYGMVVVVLVMEGARDVDGESSGVSSSSSRGAKKIM